MSYELAGILITVIVQALYIAFKMGQLEQKIVDLDKKQEKHNNLIERMVRVESSVKALWHKVEEDE